MADIFGGGASSMPQAQPQQQPMADIFGGGAPMMSTPSAPQTMSMFADANLAIDCSIIRGNAPGEYNIKAYFSNN